MADLRQTVTFTITNARAIKAMATVGRFLAEMADRYQFDSDAQRALRAFRYAAKRLDIKSKLRRSR